MTQAQTGARKILATPAARFSPENIYGDGEGRWFLENTEVTHLAVWWRCPDGHSFTASIAQRIDGVGCFACAERSEGRVDG